METVAVDTYGLRINKDVSFTDHKNRPSKRTMNRQLKLLRDFAPMLKPLLKTDEEVLLTVRACSPMSMFEQLTTGWIIFYLKRCVLVFTNKRILHFPAGTRFAPKRSVAQIHYGDIAEIKAGGFFSRVLTIKYRSGKKENFNNVESRDFPKLKTLLPSLPKESQPSESGERHHLCPRCQTRLLKGRFDCPMCQLKFKDGERAIKLSILLPGGGYFYTKHPFLGVGDALTEGSLLILLLGAIVALIAEGGRPQTWTSLVFLATALIIEKVETIYHAKHYVNEYIPVDENFAPSAAAAGVVGGSS